MKKAVLKVDLHDDKGKQKALKTVSTLSGIDSIAMDMKTQQMTVIGTVDPITVVSKLRKYWPMTDIVLVGPVEEPKKEEPKKEEAKKDGEKKEELKKEEEGKKEEAKPEETKKEEGKEGEKKEEEKKPAPPPDPVLELVRAYKAYNPHLTTYYYVQSMEENPNACVIC